MTTFWNILQSGPIIEFLPIKTLAPTKVFSPKSTPASITAPGSIVTSLPILADESINQMMDNQISSYKIIRTKPNSRQKM